MSTWPLKRTPIRRRSTKKARTDRARSAFVAEMLAQSPWCEIGLTFDHALIHGEPLTEDDWTTVSRALAGCQRRAVTLHELRKRSDTGSVLNEDNCLRACAPCNSWVEDHPRLAHDLGLVIRRGDPQWASLGRDKKER